MDIKNTFKIAQEIAALSTKYENEDIGNNEQAEVLNKKFIDELDMLHSKLLQLSMYATDKLLNKTAVNTKTYEQLSSYSNLSVYYIYENEGLALVEDTGMGLHLVPLNILRFED